VVKGIQLKPEPFSMADVNGCVSLELYGYRPI